MSRKRWNRFGVLLALALVASMLGVNVALADPVKFFLVEVDPPVAVDDTNTAFTVTVTNVSQNVLGAVEITVPSGFTVNSVGATPTTSSGQTWVSEWPVAGNASKFRLLAASQTDRLATNQSVSIGVNARTPDIDSVDNENDVDQVGLFWTGEGRQANNFNSGGNDFLQTFETRGDNFVYRDGTGLEPYALQTHETLVISGTANPCTSNGCQGNDSQSYLDLANVTVTISVERCAVGTLVVDATDFLEGDQDVMTGFYHYLPGSETASCFDPADPKRVFVDFFLPKELGVKPGDITFRAYYGVDITEFDPQYVGDDTPLPKCSKTILFNCDGGASGGQAGTTARMVLILVPTDPGGSLFR